MKFTDKIMGDDEQLDITDYLYVDGGDATEEGYVKITTRYTLQHDNLYKTTVRTSRDCDGEMITTTKWYVAIADINENVTPDWILTNQHTRDMQAEKAGY